MPSPSSSVAGLRADLAAGFSEYDLEMDRKGFIGLRVAPMLSVDKDASSFSIIPLEQLLQNRDTERAPGSGYQRGKFEFTKSSYQTKENGWEEPVDDKEAAMYGDWLKADQLAASRAFDFVLRAHERRVAALLFNTTTYNGATLTTGIATDWTQHASAVPVDNIDAAVLKVYDLSGIWPNSLIITRQQFRHLRRCDQIVDLLKANPSFDPTARGITPSILSSVFDLPNIIIAGGNKNTADMGQSATIANIWNNDYAMVCYIDQGEPDTKIPSIARTFHWDGDGSEIGGHFEEYREEQTRSKIIRVRHETDERVMYTELGHLLTGCTT